MSTMTLEQVEVMAADLRNAPATSMLGTHISLPAAKAVAMYEALCDYAALLCERESQSVYWECPPTHVGE